MTSEGLTKNAAYMRALERLKTVVAKAEANSEIQRMIQVKDEVLTRYRPILNPDNIAELREVDFRSFLYFENNRHWTGLTRQVSRLTADMAQLRHALALLLDESRPIAERFDEALGSVKGLGKALATAVLLVSYPDHYGVWNNISEAGLKELDLWPSFDRGTTMGQKYEQINRILNELARDLGVDLWTLDALTWGMIHGEDGQEERNKVQFGLERHLHEFLRDNWDFTELGEEWAIYSEPGDDTAGYEYPTDVGRIDILARHKSLPEWLVIELKRGQSNDQTVGQVLRYMGWVERYMATPDEAVKGMIISHTVDKAMLYAVNAVGNDRISVMQYEVEFHLKSVRL